MGGSASYRLGKKIQQAIDNGAPQSEIDALRQQREIARILEQMKRAQKRAMSSFKVEDKFSSERKEAAQWRFPREINDALLPVTSKVWNESTEKQKDRLWNYTGGDYQKINSSFKEGAAISQSSANMINDITDMIERSELPIDMWMNRGVSVNGARRLFGDDLSIEGIQKLIDNRTPVVNKAFMSCGSTDDTGREGDVQLKVFAPKGTKALYTEPVSLFTGDKAVGGRNWDGKTSPSVFSDEFETIIQRGAILRPVRAYHDYRGKLTVEVEVIGQETLQPVQATK